MNNKLEVPVTYQGGKQRIASKIMDVILERNSNIKFKDFYDLCCGSGAITIECLNRNAEFASYNMMDYSVWGDFWKSIGDGNFLLDMFKIYVDDVPSDKKEIELYMKEMVSESPYDGVILSHVYRFLLIQANAFGGTAVWIEDNRWKKAGGYRGYWMPTKTSNRKSPVNPMMPMAQSLYKRVETLWSEMQDVIIGKNKNVELCTFYPDNSIIYIDPPYEGTTGYGNSFDVVKWVNEVKKNCSAKIYVSEQKPLGNTSFLISEKRKKGNISGNSDGIQEWLTEF